MTISASDPHRKPPPKQKSPIAEPKLPSIFESEFIRNHGAIIPVECRARFIRNTTGKVISFQRSYREITDRKHSEATLKREHLFDKFTQADASTTFWFSLRLPISEQIESDVFSVADLKEVRTLIVDDDAVSRRVLHTQLKRWGKQPDNTPSAAEALVAVQRASSAGLPYQFAFLNHHLPGIDGETLGRSIKADPALERTVLVLLTSLAQRDTERESAESKFAASLTKPVRQAHLFTALATAL